MNLGWAALVCGLISACDQRVNLGDHVKPLPQQEHPLPVQAQIRFAHLVWGSPTPMVLCAASDETGEASEKLAQAPYTGFSEYAAAIDRGTVALYAVKDPNQECPNTETPLATLAIEAGNLLAEHRYTVAAVQRDTPKLVLWEDSATGSDEPLAIQAFHGAQVSPEQHALRLCYDPPIGPAKTWVSALRLGEVSQPVIEASIEHGAQIFVTNENSPCQAHARALSASGFVAAPGLTQGNYKLLLLGDFRSGSAHKPQLVFTPPVAMQAQAPLVVLSNSPSGHERAFRKTTASSPWTTVARLSPNPAHTDYPFIVKRVRYELMGDSELGCATGVGHELYLTSYTGVMPPPGVERLLIQGSVENSPERRVVEVTLDPPINLNRGEHLFAGITLPVDGSGNALCIAAYNGKPLPQRNFVGSEDEHGWFTWQAVESTEDQVTFAIEASGHEASH